MSIAITDLPANRILEPDSLTTAREVMVPVRTQTESNSKEKWYTRHARAKKQKIAVRRAFLGALVPTLPVVVTFVRMSPATMDDDNLPSASKHLRDSIAEMYGVKDGPKDPIQWRYEQEKCKPGTFGVRVRIETPERFALRATA